MENQNTFLGSSISHFVTQQTLLTGRMMFFLAMILYPPIGYMYLLWLEGIIDPWPIRWAITGLLAASYMGSFISTKIKSNISLVSIVLFYVLTAHILYLIYINNVNFYYVIGLVITMSTSSVITNSLLSLLVYSLFTIIGGITVVLNVEDPLTNLNVFILWLVVTCSVSGVLLFVRLNLYLELSSSHKIISKANVITLLFNQEADIIRAGGSTKRILGYDHNKLLGDGWWNITHQKESQETLNRDVIQSYFSEENGTLDEYIDQLVLKKNGEICWLHWNFTKLTQNLIIGTSQDITELHNSQERILKLYEQSQNQARELREANNEYQDLMYTFSHDLKTPFRGVAALANILIADYASSSEKEKMAQLALLKSRAIEVYNLVDGFLEFSNIRVGYGMSEQVSIEKTIKESIDSIKTPEHISIKHEDNLPKIKGEDFLLKELFDKLLQNAVDYIDKKKGRISISCIDIGDYYEFAIEDNGMGIEELNSNRIFKLFQIGSSEKKGAGVGLAVAQKIVKLHGGTIWYESKKEQGTTFYFTLKK